MEAMTAASPLMAGAGLLVVRHPRTAQMIRTFVAEMAK